MPQEGLMDLIVGIFGLPERPRDAEIPKELLLEWMQTNDIEVLGVLYAFTSKPEYAKRIQPPLTLPEYRDFLLRYFEYCLRLNPDGEWAHTRYEAGWDLVSWFTKLWQEKEASHETLRKIKTWLASLYKDADADTRRCVVDATLEHLFENREISRFFADWKDDADLAIAYAAATEWNASNKGHSD